MKNFKHTPGPWLIEELELGESVYISVPNFTICKAWRGLRDSVPESELQANAHLIAAAPEMLEALELMNQVFDDIMGPAKKVDWGKTFGVNFGLINEGLIKMTRAIAKARGGA